MDLEIIIPEENLRLRFFKKLSSDSQNIKKSYLWVGIKNKKIDKILLNYGLVEIAKVAKFFIRDKSWFVPFNTSENPQQTVLGEYIASTGPTELL